MESLRVAPFWNVPSCSIANTRCPSPSSVESSRPAEAQKAGVSPGNPLPTHYQQRSAPPQLLLDEAAIPEANKGPAVQLPSQTQIF